MKFQIAAFIAFVGKLFQLVSSLATYANNRNIAKGAKATVMVEALSQLTELIQRANAADIEFHTRLRDDPDWLFFDDGFKRKKSHRIRDSTDRPKSHQK